MAIVIPNEGKALMLTWLLDGGTPGNLSLVLFTTSVTIAAASVYADFTPGITEGLSIKTLTNGSWTVVTANPATATYSSQFSWTSSGATHTIYGYIVYTGTTVMWGETFASGIATYTGLVSKLTGYVELSTT